MFSQIGDPDPVLHSLDGIRQVVVSFYRLAERHPCIVGLLYTPSAARLRRAATDTAALEGVLGDHAAKALQALVAFTNGSIQQLRLGGPTRRDAFAYSLDIMTEGLRAGAAAQGKRDGR